MPNFGFRSLKSEMSLAISKSSTYAIRSMILMIRLEQEEGRRYVPVSDLARRLGIPFHFLTKILQKLTGAGMIESSRGARGGVRLAVPPGAVSLMDVVRAIDGPQVLEACVLGLPECGGNAPCPLHDRWVTERKRIVALFEKAKLSKLHQY